MAFGSLSIEGGAGNGINPTSVLAPEAAVRPQFSGCRAAAAVSCIKPPRNQSPLPSLPEQWDGEIRTGVALDRAPVKSAIRTPAQAGALKVLNGGCPYPQSARWDSRFPLTVVGVPPAFTQKAVSCHTPTPLAESALRQFVFRRALRILETFCGYAQPAEVLPPGRLQSRRRGLRRGWPRRARGPRQRAADRQHIMTVMSTSRNRAV